MAEKIIPITTGEAASEIENLSQNKSDNALAVTYVIDPLEEKTVLRKLDRVILPLMALVYFFQCKREKSPDTSCAEADLNSRS